MKYIGTNFPNKPVLDQETFQHLLAAAYTLQTQNPRTERKTDYPKILRNAFSTSRHRMVIRRVSPIDELFWRVAPLIAAAAVSALLLSASIHRLSPIPAGVELVKQEAPFRRSVTRSAITKEPVAGKISDRTVDVDDHPTAAPTTFQKAAIVNRPAAYESEADLVAPNTVVRYDAPPVVPRGRSQNR